MDNKENSAVGGGGLSAEQRNRISQNYRAAKALLARKRARESDNHSLQKMDGKEIGCQTFVPVNKRVPLSDISTNMATACSTNNFMLTAGECSGRKLSVPTKQGTGLDSFRTPVRKPCEFDDYSLQRPDAKEIECRTLGPVNRRAPLSDIQSNRSAPCSTKNFMLTHSQCIGSKVTSAAKQGAGLDSFKTPIKQPNPILVNNNESIGGIGSSLISKDMVVHAECGKVVGSCPARGPGLTSSSCSRNTSASKIELSNCISANLSAMKMTKVDENGKTPDSHKTPIRKLNYIGSTSLMVGAGNITESSAGGPTESKSSLTERQEKDSCLSDSRSVLDEDLDESILQEIDALCYSKPEAIARPQSMAGTLQMKSQCSEMDGRDCKTDAGLIDLKEILRTEELLDSVDVRNCVKEGSKTSEIGCMPEAYAKYMQSLNDKQREAACSDISIPLMVVAGPGSGKTSTMVGRVLMLLNEGISPSNILAMTFTTAAASEMRDRIGAVAGKEVAKELMISTFHSFSLQLCRSHAEKLERTPEFLIYGQGQQRRAIIEAIRLCENEKKAEDSDISKLAEDTSGINSLQYFKDKAKKWLKFVTQAKASGKNSQECQKTGDEIGAAILQNYSNILKSCNALDYHDLISCSVKLLTDFPGVLKECQESWKAIVIDEFQDTSAMQYTLLRILASHNRITIVGDEDQSIFSFNGANAYGFNSFRNNFPMYKEIRLDKNYRSTRCIIEAASFLIRNNAKRSHTKRVLTDNTSGSKITIKECCSEDAQCAYVVDKILENTCDGSFVNSSFGNVAVLYRRQVSGKIFQKAFRDRKIPFNIHGVAFYRKKVVRAIISMLNTTLPGCDDSSFRRVFKALLSFEKEEKKKVVEHVNKISTVRRCSFISAARDIFSAKISGTFKRNQLTQGRKVLLTLDMISKLVNREQSISAVISSVANMVPQKYLLEQRAVIDVDGGKLLNEDNDIRSVLQYLLDDVSEYLSLQKITVEKTNTTTEEKGCLNVLKGFIDYIYLRESENFRTRKHENEHSVTLTTIHQSKGLEWDTVFIVKTNESEIPLLHESNGVTYESTSTLEEERRLLYVAMTRARKKLFILYVLMDSNWQVIQPSRFLKEIPKYLQDGEDEQSLNNWQAEGQLPEETLDNVINGIPSLIEIPKDSMELACNGSSFLKRFSTEDRSVVSHLFHHWGKKAAFQEPKRLLGKVGFVIDERLRVRKSTHKDVLRELKSCLSTDEAFQYAEYVLKWEQIPADQRAYIMREKQEHFLKLRIENAMGSSEPTSKQISYLHTLGCTVVPTSRLHASRLIEQYKAL